MKKNNKSNLYLNRIISYLIIALSGFFFFILLISIFSYINIKNPIFDNYELYIELASVAIASALTGIISCRIKNKAIINGSVAGLFLSVYIILIITLISGFDFNLKELIISGICIFISTCSAVIKCNFMKNKRRK